MSRYSLMSFLAVILFFQFSCSSDGMIFNSSGTTRTTEPQSSDSVAVATFAGGCFWCMESHLQEVEGVLDVVSGYIGGTTESPTYHSLGDHIEAVEVTFDPRRIGYMKLLDVFWKSHNPTDATGQFADRGTTYRSAIFFHTLQQRAQIYATQKSLETAAVFDKPIVTRIRPASTFYTAEEYHQDYYLKNPDHYKRYSAGSGRDGFLEKTWDGVTWNAPSQQVDTYTKPADSILKVLLTPLQYDITQNMGTEPPFNNPYWDNHQRGIYVDIVTGEPLFSSIDKFDSGTGWPSFTKPLPGGHVDTTEDTSHGMVRTEVHSTVGTSHLGHIFNDGPAPTHIRYCIDSAALLFIPAERLVQEGYGRYASLFEM